MGQTASADRQFIDSVVKLPTKQNWRSAETGAVLREFSTLLARYHESESAFGMLERREIIKASTAVLDLLRKLVAAPAEGSSPSEQDLSLRDVLFTLYNCFRFTFVAKKLFSSSLDVLHTVLRGNMRQASLCLCLVMTGLAAADEHTKPQLCSQMDSVGFHQCMVDVLTFCAAHAPTGPSDEVDWTCYTVLQYLNWVLQTQKAGTDTTAARVQSNLLQQQDALFELAGHPLLVINNEASKLLCNLLLAESATWCRAVQEAALPYGVPLWQLTRCVSLILKGRHVPPLCDPSEEEGAEAGQESQHQEEQGGVEEEKAGIQQAPEYPMLSETIPATPEGIMSPPIEAPSLRDALTVAEDCLILLCMGSPSNSQIVLRALPDAMTLYLVQKPRKASPRGTGQSRQEKFAHYHEKLAGSGNWAQLITSLKDDAFSPRLVWNENTLTHLYKALARVNAELKNARRLKYVPWKSESFEISYPMYRDLLCVRGYFLPALVRELETGISSHLSDPVKMTWSVHDHLHHEADETNKTLCMRLLRLLVSRYSNLLADTLPIGFLTQQLKAATASITSVPHSTQPQDVPSIQWLGECIHLLKERLTEAERQDVLDFVHMGGLQLLADLLSSYMAVLTLRATVDRTIQPIPTLRPAVDKAVSDGEDDDDDDTDAETEGRLPAKLLNKTKHSVFVSCATLLKHLLDVSADAARQLAEPSRFEGLMRALWLLGPHGPLEPIGQPWAVSQTVLAIQRVLSVSPRLLADIDANRLLSILIAVSIQRSGIGMMGRENSTLLYELRTLSADPDNAGKKVPTKVVLKQRQSVHSIQELLHLRAIFPVQLISLATSMKADGFTVIFNADVTSSDVLWNSEMRKHCVEGLIGMLRPWYQEFMPVAEGNSDEEPPRRVHYPLLDQQPQVAGILLRGFLTAQPNSFVMPFDVSFFARELFRTIRQWNRVGTSATSPQPDSRRARDAPGIHESFHNTPTEECAALLSLSVCQLLKNFSLPEELWSNDGMATVCHAVQASLERMEQPMAQPAKDSETMAWHWYAVSAGACVLLRSLSAKLTLDDSVVKTQVSMFTQNLREFRRSQQGFAQVFASASEVLTPALRSCAAVLDAYNSDDVEQSIFACDLFMTASASLVCTLLRRCVATRDGNETPESSPASAAHSGHAMEVKHVFRVMQETSIFREFIKLCDSKISVLCPRGVYSVIVALRRLFRISLEHAAATKQMLLEGGLLILVLDTVVSLILSDEENRKCFSPRRPTEAVEKPDLERSTSYLKTDLEEDAIDLQCVQACTDVEDLLQKFVLDVPAAKRHVRDKSVWPDFRPMLVREGILLLQEFVRGSHPSEEEQPAAAASSKQQQQQQVATKPAADSVEATAAAVLNQLLTPPLAHLLVDDPRTFIDVLASERVRRPVAYWDSSMLQTLQQVIGEEMHRIHSAFGLDSWPAWTAQELLVREGYKAAYPQVAEEAIVDNIYVASLTDPANFTDLGGRPIGEFVHSLQASIQSSQRILKHLQAARNPAANSVVAALSLKERVLALILQKHPECDWRGGTYHDG